ncbi:hypothetical protein [Sulfitobacter sp.]|uniref:hypothetical protein n=1 Tax=Sulfitobacter sp. TaxID=1903071 RepID=UPI003FCD5910
MFGLKPTAQTIPREGTVAFARQCRCADKGHWPAALRAERTARHASFNHLHAALGHRTGKLWYGRSRC